MFLTAGEQVLGKQALLQIVCLHMGLHSLRKDPVHGFAAAVIMFTEIIKDHAVSVTVREYAAREVEKQLILLEHPVQDQLGYKGRKPFHADLLLAELFDHLVGLDHVTLDDQRLADIHTLRSGECLFIKF